MDRPGEGQRGEAPVDVPDLRDAGLTTPPPHFPGALAKSCQLRDRLRSRRVPATMLANASRGPSMQLACPHCGQVLDLPGKRPSFCAYCGKALPDGTPRSTVEFDHEAVTRPPTQADTVSQDDATPAPVVQANDPKAVPLRKIGQAMQG
jgi:hypothetical protein